MTEAIQQAGATPAPATPPSAPRFADEHSPLSVMDALRSMRGSAEEKPDEEEQKPATPPAEGEGGAAQEDSSDEEANAAAAEEQPSDDTEAENDDAQAEELEPIAPPASWTKEERKHWESLPRELQESLADRERVRRADFDRRHNETNRQLQDAKAAQQAAEQARKQYEDQIPVLAGIIAQQVNAEFADIKSWDDVHKMAAEDPVRYSRFSALQAQREAVQREQVSIQQRQQKEAADQARQFMDEQATLFLEKAPEYADPEKGAELRSKAFDTLISDYGFTEDDISLAWRTGGAIPVHDHRFQLLVRDATRYRQAQQAVKTVKPVQKTASVTPKPAPVQKPGPAVSPKDTRSEHIKALDSRLSRTGKISDAVALLRAGRGR